MVILLLKNQSTYEFLVLDKFNFKKSNIRDRYADLARQSSKRRQPIFLKILIKKYCSSRSCKKIVAISIKQGRKWLPVFLRPPKLTQKNVIKNKLTQFSFSILIKILYSM